MVSKEKAFEIALENRKFEIELYWKRAKYFLDAFLALGGVSILISVLQTSKAINLPFPIFFAILFAVECIGLVCAVAWSLVNEGSKYWQVNWEQYVDALGEDIVGPLFKHPIEPESNELKRYSVSNINLYLSRYIVSVWVVMIVATLFVWIFICWCSSLSVNLDLRWLSLVLIPIFAVCSLVAIRYMCCRSKGKNSNKKHLDSNIEEYFNAIGEPVSLSKKEEERRVKIRLFSLFTILSHSKRRERTFH
ncbi:hypothetical protein [Porphyromonas uenonis]|uniref:RipA family octameric membrane protein n=1 Tax=Porphyromonas uenonis TaxID=281920 RepID=UPI0026F331F7|nr:hypothetical protein [Porphyromonas uenonis]